MKALKAAIKRGIHGERLENRSHDSGIPKKLVAATNENAWQPGDGRFGPFVTDVNDLRANAELQLEGLGYERVASTESGTTFAKGVSPQRPGEAKSIVSLNPEGFVTRLVHRVYRDEPPRPVYEVTVTVNDPGVNAKTDCVVIRGLIEKARKV
jgi:hypothetical protein